MRRLLYVILAVLAITLIISSCGEVVENADISSEDVQNSSVPEGKVLVKMDFSRAFEHASEGSMRAGESEYEIYYLYWKGIKSGSEDIVETFEPTEIELVLDRDDIYIIGLVGRRKEGWIETIGLIGVGEGFGALPIGDSAASVIDLGELRYEDGEFVLENSVVDLTKFGFSLETMKLLKGYSEFLAKYSNLDIDHDGVMDKNQANMKGWWVGLGYLILTKDEYELEDGKLIDPVKSSIVFSILYTDIDFKSCGYRLNTPPCDTTRVATLYRLTPEGSEMFGDLERAPFDYSFFQWYFLFDPYTVVDGDYVLEAEDSDGNIRKFYFQNLKFLNLKSIPSVPIVSVEQYAYSDGRIEKVKWEWWAYESKRERIKPTSDFVRLVIEEPGIYFYFTYDKGFHGVTKADKRFWDVQTLEHLKDGIDFSVDNDGFVPVEGDLWVIGEGCDWAEWLVGSLDINSSKPYKFEYYPHDYDEDLKGFLPSKSEHVYGMWLNFHSHRFFVLERDGTIRNFELHMFSNENVIGDVIGSYSFEGEGKMRITLKDGEEYYTLVELKRTYMELQLSSEGYPERIVPGSDGYLILSRFRPYFSVPENVQVTDLGDGRVKISWDFYESDVWKDFIGRIRIYVGSKNYMNQENPKSVYESGYTEEAIVDLSGVDPDSNGRYYWKMELEDIKGNVMETPVMSFQIGE